jgi:hypothetical protein
LKKGRYNDYVLSAAALFVASAITLGLAFLTDRGDVSSAALVLSGMVCFIAGVLLFSFSREDPPDPGLVSLLPAGGMIAVARLCADLSVTGNACFVPGKDGQCGSMIVPAGETLPAIPKEDFSFILAPEGNAVLLYSSSGPVLSALSGSNGFRLPSTADDLPPAAKDLYCSLLEVADTVEVRKDESSVTFLLGRFRLLQGCLQVRGESPRVCMVYPCPVCSLAGVLAASSTGRICRLDQTDPDQKNMTMTVIFSFT